MPYFGFCLGHQLLADALMQALPQNFKVLQWHGVAVTELPEGSVTLASSPLCAIQAQRVGRHAWGLQYHVEMTDQTVRERAAVLA